jgi:hypothetical protein
MTTAEAEFMACLSHSPSMRSISADVANANNIVHHHHHHHHPYASNNGNYILMNRSQDLTSLHSTHSTSISIQPQPRQNPQQQHYQQHAASSSHHGSGGGGGGGGGGSTRKLSRILYEIGSILSFVGLGRDYKHHQQSSQTPTSLHASNSIVHPSATTPSSSSFSSSSFGHSSSKTRRSQDKKLTPSTSTAGNRNDHHHLV